MKIRNVISVICAAAVILSGCVMQPQQLTRYSAQFLEVFDTITSVTGYAKSKDEFTEYVNRFRDELIIYHELYDIYKDYEGINNLKTVNDMAGIEPVKVDQKIIDLLLYSKEMYQETDGRFDVAMGSVLKLWHSCRTEAVNDPENARIPEVKALEEAAGHTDMADIVIDEAAQTVFLKDSEMSLDVGAIAKGFALEQIVHWLEEEYPQIRSVMFSVGGNVRTIGSRDDGSSWKLGIQNPDLESSQKYVYVVPVDDMSLVSSGTYQRYFTVEGKRYHHIINPDTLMPENNYLSVSVLCKDSGMADALSTAVFNMPLEEGKALIDSLEGVEAMWILEDSTQVYSLGFPEDMGAVGE